MQVQSTRKILRAHQALISVVTMIMGIISCLVNVIAERVDAVYDVGLGSTAALLQFLMPKCYFRMILVLFSQRSHFPLCALAMQVSLSRQEHCLSLSLIPMPSFCGLKDQETSDVSYLFSPESPCHHLHLTLLSCG
jgi:hypothetical protein